METHLEKTSLRARLLPLFGLAVLSAGAVCLFAQGHRARLLGGLLLTSSAIALLALTWWRLAERIRELTAQKERLEVDNGRLRQTADRARRRAQHLLDHAGDAIFLIDPAKGDLLEANRRAEDLLGYSAEEIRSLSPAVLFPGRHRRTYLRLVQKVLARGYGEEPGLVFRRRDGSQFVGAVHARLGDLGDRQMVHGVIRDVTAVKRIEEELRRKNRDLLLFNDIAHQAAASGELSEMLTEVLRRVVGASEADGGGIYLVRHQGNELELAAHQGLDAKALKELRRLGSNAGLLGRVVASGQPRSTADLQRDRRAPPPALTEAGAKGFQAVPLVTDRTVIGVMFIFSKARRLFNREELRLLLAIGRQLGAVVLGAQMFEALNWQCRLTEASNRELERSRQQLRQNLLRLEEANQTMARLDRMKSNFLALASHELRTPLTYVLSGAELLQTSLDSRLSPEEKRTLEAVQLGGRRLEQIVRDLLEVARIESQSLYLARQPVHLPAIFAELGQEFRPILEERRLSLRTADSPVGLDLVGDDHHLRQTFRRLIENAVKFTPEGGRIEIRARLTGAGELLDQRSRLHPFSPAFFQGVLPERLVQVSILDSGLGIAPQDQLRIFDKFYETGEISGHFTSQVRFGGKGVGMGLTLVKGMVEAHGGMVWVESGGVDGASRGSTFHVVLPLNPPSPAATAWTASPP